MAYSGSAPTCRAGLPSTMLAPRPRQLPAAAPSPPAAHASLCCYLRHRGGSSFRGRGDDSGCCGPRNADLRCRRRLLTARGGEGPPPPDEEEPVPAGGGGFDAAVALFNRGEYHACHDVVEDLWYAADDPARTLLHAVLQCAVGFHHLFNQNHRGAMMELGEGLCKLRKLHLDDDDDDPFSRFRDEVAAVLHFLYRTQKELAACADDMCLTMDGSPSSYQLLGNFAAGQQLYRLATDAGGAASIVFSVSDDHRASPAAPPAVKLPMLQATEQDLTQLQRAYQYM